MSKKSTAPAFIGSETEVRLARYRQIERETDAMGRLIGVRRLKPSEQGRLHSYISDLNSAVVKIPDPEGGPALDLDIKLQYFLAAAVCEIDRTPIPFARNRGELDAILDRLDMEGLGAAGRALVKLNPATLDQKEEGEPADPLAQAKNS